MLPFILGVLGLIFQFNRNNRDGFTVFVLFFFTGIATAIYLNMAPLQPRERDYAFAGSTYAFCCMDWSGCTYGQSMVPEIPERQCRRHFSGSIITTVGSYPHG